jgi:alpha-amylase
MIKRTVFALVFAFFAQVGWAAPPEDERVMLQGFYWESSRHGLPQYPQFGARRWYEIVSQQSATIADAGFDLVWLPSPCYAGDDSAGYNPKQYWNLGNAYGSEQQQREMLSDLLRSGVEPVADIVINHRDGTSGWGAFDQPKWGPWAICQNDEAFTDSRSELRGTSVSQRGAQEQSVDYDPKRGRTEAYADYRDLDHTNRDVRKDIVRYLKLLRSVGYRGWRFDMVHGYHADWIRVYNRLTSPTFSVGEFDWDDFGGQRGWVFRTGGGLDSASNVFDFSTHFHLEGNKGNPLEWSSTGLIQDQTDGLPWKQRAVTFAENHDTGFRTKPDGSPDDGHTQDSFANNQEIEQVYAYLLTQPGVPCVYWKHYFDWGKPLQNKIKSLIAARKAAGVHSGSQVHFQQNARNQGILAAVVEGHRGRLFVRIGDGDWQPSDSGFQNYRMYADGNGWRVWVAIPGNPPIRSVSRHAPFAIPQRIEQPENLPVSDAEVSAP